MVQTTSKALKLGWRTSIAFFSGLCSISLNLLVGLQFNLYNFNLFRILRIGICYQNSSTSLLSSVTTFTYVLARVEARLGQSKKITF